MEKQLIIISKLRLKSLLKDFLIDFIFLIS